MKLTCKVYNTPALIVGYVQNRRKVRAIVIMDGKLAAISLSKIQLDTDSLPTELQSPKTRIHPFLQQQITDPNLFSHLKTKDQS